MKEGSIMSKLFEEMQPAVKQETKRVAVMTLAGVVLMWVVYAVLHIYMPEKVPLDYTVFLGGLGGAAVAIGNFLWMGLTVQKVVSIADEDAAILWQVFCRCCSREWELRSWGY